jgi:hypothetical protein
MSLAGSSDHMQGYLTREQVYETRRLRTKVGRVDSRGRPLTLCIFPNMVRQRAEWGLDAWLSWRARIAFQVAPAPPRSTTLSIFPGYLPFPKERKLYGSFQSLYFLCLYVQVRMLLWEILCMTWNQLSDPTQTWLVTLDGSPLKHVDVEFPSSWSKSPAALRSV